MTCLFRDSYPQQTNHNQRNQVQAFYYVFCGALHEYFSMMYETPKNDFVKCLVRSTNHFYDCDF